ncbi:MAG: amidohydrolase family protein [Chloroflexi bacterium]|nr:amidohydrolase family protein [Chloroflexota bacterium]
MIVGGRVIGLDREDLNLAIVGERIVAVLPAHEQPDAWRTVDAGGKLVLPGLVDLFGGSLASSDPELADRAHGGVTTVGLAIDEGVELRPLDSPVDVAVIDAAFVESLTRTDLGNVVHLPELLTQAAGVSRGTALSTVAPSSSTALPAAFTASVAYTALVVRGGLSVADFVQQVAAEPARRLGLFPTKGALVPGADADVLVLDPEATMTLTDPSAPLHGAELTGQPIFSLLRGAVLLLNGQVHRRPGFGRICNRPVTPGETARHPTGTVLAGDVPTRA